MNETVMRDGFLWPVSDDWCWRVIHSELPDLDEALKLVPGRSVAVQAGGNVGVWAAHLARVFATVYTFEPDAENYGCLIRNVPDNVECKQVGLGDAPGPATMTKVVGNAGAHYIGWEEREATGTVDMITIDSLNLPACDFLCLDIEGAEPMALHGAVETIRKFRPVIMMEEKGLSERYFNIREGAAERWLIREHGYKVAKKVRKDVIMVPK